MEGQTVNGVEDTAFVSEEKSVKFVENNNEGETDQSHLIEAEVNHHTEEEPIAVKRNIFLETDNQKHVITDDNVADEAVSGDADSVEYQTSENFIKIEERKTIERLSRVIETELSVESFRVDTENTQEVNELEREESEPDQEPITPTPESVAAEEVNDESANRFQVSVSQDNGEDNTPTNEEPVETGNEVELRSEEVEENHFQTNTEESNNENEDKAEETFKTEPVVEEERRPVVEDVVVKQNGRKTVYSSEEDAGEEEDEMPEFTGFKSKLKMWSNGKSGDRDGAEDPPVDSKEKFKTLRQIRKGNTRSLMERFQTST